MKLFQKLPVSLQKTRLIGTWFARPYLRANSACEAICDLGTNAACAIPELEAMMGDPTKIEDASRARFSLAGIGEPAVPVLRAALADADNSDRWQIVRTIAEMTNYTRRPQASFTMDIEARKQEDVNVRQEATNAMRTSFPQLLTNAPAR